MTVTSKGQTTIPGTLRRALGLQPGDRLQVWRDGDCIVARKIRLAPPSAGAAATSGALDGSTRRASGPPIPRRPADRQRDRQLLTDLTETLERLIPHEKSLQNGTVTGEVVRSEVVPALLRVGDLSREISTAFKQFGGPKIDWEVFDALVPGLDPARAASWATRHLEFLRMFLRIFVDVANGRKPLSGVKRPQPASPAPPRGRTRPSGRG